VAFPNAGLGETPTRANFVIRNLNAKRPLAGNVGGATGPFGIISGDGPFSIGPLGMLKVRMTFTPAGLGVEKGSLLITTSDKVHPSVTVNLSGAGEPGVPSLSTPNLAFGTVGVGLPGKTLTLKIHNTGLGVLHGSVEGFLTGPFDVLTDLGTFAPIAPGGMLEVKVMFTPTVAGPASKTLVINTDDPLLATIHVPIIGTGGPGRLTTNLPTASAFTSLNET